MKGLLPLAIFACPPLAVALGMLLRTPDSANLPGAELGRRVYVSEGCINCHSQFVRPGADADVGLGPARGPDFPRHQSPVLIGNRRQGPDLMNVGLRRPRDWQRLHLLDPRSVSPGSVMPSYGYLFSASRTEDGEALLDYLDSLGHDFQPADKELAQVSPSLPRVR